MKNTNGQGSISYEADRKTYRAAIVDVNGKRIRKRFPTKQAAEEWLTITRASFYTNTYIPKTDYTLGDWIIEYLETYAKNVVEETTYATYKHALSSFNDIADINLTELNAIVLQKFFQNHYEDKDATRYNCFIVLRTILKKATNLGIIQHNPLDNVDVKKPEREEVEVFTKEELQSIFKVTQTNPYYKKYYPLILLATTTGMRPGELLGLKWSNVFPTHINVTNALKVVASRQIYGKTKTPSGKRIISIPKYVYDVLQTLDQDCEYVFHTRNNTPYLERNLSSQVWTKILENANVKYKKLYTLRHNHATFLLANGIPIADISRRLGHKNISTTLNIYSHFIPNQTDTIPEKIMNIYGIAPTLPPQ